MLKPTPDLVTWSLKRIFILLSNHKLKYEEEATYVVPGTYIHVLFALTLLAPTYYPSALTFSSSRPQNSIWLWWRPPLNRRLCGTMTLAWPWTGIPILAPLRHNPMCNDGGKYVESTCLTYIIYCIDKHKYYAIA